MHFGRRQMCRCTLAEGRCAVALWQLSMGYGVGGLVHGARCMHIGALKAVWADISSSERSAADPFTVLLSLLPSPHDSYSSIPN